MRHLLRDLKTYSSFDRKKGRFGLGPIRDELKALVLWIFEDDGHSDAPFPFALPHLDFAKRCQNVDEKITQWIRHPRNAAETRAIECLQRLITSLDLSAIPCPDDSQKDREHLREEISNDIL
jgi:hypothetical protein